MRIAHNVLLTGCIAAAVTGAASARAFAQWPDSLTESQAAQVAEGRVVVLQQDVEGAPWPRVRLYRFINATPEQSVAMLADYEHQRRYTADLKEARIVRRLDSARTEVFFRLASNVPFVSDVTYSVLDQIVRDSDETYRIQWTFLSGSKVKSIEGSARFSAWTNPRTGSPGTLLTYDNFVVPQFPFASLGFVRRKGVAAMRDAVDAIAVEVERELREDRSLLDGQVAALRAALAEQSPTR